MIKFIIRSRVLYTNLNGDRDTTKFEKSLEGEKEKIYF